MGACEIEPKIVIDNFQNNDAKIIRELIFEMEELVHEVISGSSKSTSLWDKDDPGITSTLIVGKKTN